VITYPKLPGFGQIFAFRRLSTHAGPVNVSAREAIAPTSYELVRHVAQSTGLPPGVAARVVAEVAAYFMENIQDYVRRRHRELQSAGLRNDAIFTRVSAELAHRPVAPPTLSARQLRRIVYT
jgi:hypothetical protein